MIDAPIARRQPNPCSVVNAMPGIAGGEAQQTDIQQLLHELEVKKAKLNELKGEAQRCVHSRDG